MEEKRSVQIIFATGNQGKIREINEIIRTSGSREYRIEVLSMREAGVFAEPEENGKDFEDNALIKAQAVYDLLLSRPVPKDTARIVMSDDSGLEIDALGGAPGVHSARYMGYDTDYRLRMEHLLDLLKDVPDEKRTARFVAAVAAIFPAGGLFPDASGSEGGDPKAFGDSASAAASFPAGDLFPDASGSEGGDPKAPAASPANAASGTSEAPEACAPAVTRLVVRGTMEGRIGHEIAGKNGFGYDPFFYLPQYGKTSAEIPPEVKNSISHRGKALRMMLKKLGLL